MNKILYESSWLFLEPTFWISVVIFVILTKRCFKKERTTKPTIFTRILWVFFLIILVGQMNLYCRIVIPYKTGSYQTVEGYVENFDPRPLTVHKDESFDINNTHFFYSSLTPGYCRPSSMGGVITENGQHLRIRYIPYGHGYGNVITYIEEIE